MAALFTCPSVIFAFMSAGPIDPNQPPEPKPKTGPVSAHDETLGDLKSTHIPNRVAPNANDVNHSNNLPNATPADEPALTPTVIGRYRVERLLGAGSFWPRLSRP